MHFRWRSIKNNEYVTSLERPRFKPVTGVDIARQGAVRNTIYQMYEHCQYITLKSLRQKLVDIMDG